MSYITSFMDGEKYGANDINKIVSHFIHSGIEEAFVDGEPYNVRRLNDLSKPITTRGVIGSESSALLVSKSGDSYYISPGTAFFGNGSTLEVIENEVITIAASTLKNYVYLVSSEEENRNYIEVSTTEPDVANENFVMLAEISPDGTITDRRCYATGKLRGMYQDNEFKLKSIRIQDNITISAHDVSGTTVEHDLEASEIHMMIFFSWKFVDKNGDYVEKNYYDSFDKDTHLENVTMMWLPREDIYTGIIAHAGNNERYTVICNEKDYAFPLGLDNYSSGASCMLRLSPSAGGKWNFTYKPLAESSSTQTSSFDFKLYYI